MGKAGKGKGAPANMKDKGKVVTDPRFARMHTDARFQVIPRKQRKVQLDERFQGRAAAPEWPPLHKWAGSDAFIDLLDRPMQDC